MTVHLHGLDFMEYLPSHPAPSMATLHLPPERYLRPVNRLARPAATLRFSREAYREAVRRSTSSQKAVVEGSL
ncbi:MAG TPA: hypothetical protein VMG40_12970 [Bryobacteraceae bacterium]|nr:hypothetical protein [Bryobacteraceae bacterium]